MYTLREISKNIFEVAKFSDYKEPDAIYIIKNNKCSCPASYKTKNCKHKKLLTTFNEVKQEDHIYSFDLVNDKVITYVI